MIVAGFGLRSSATVASLQSALALTGQRVTDLAVVADKAALPAIQGLAAATGLPLHSVAVANLSPDAQTLSPRQPARYGKASVAEAAALAVAGVGAQLIQTRLTSPDGMATVAIAKGAGL
jgi:cobalt-precorrin 5A hydrolase